MDIGKFTDKWTSALSGMSNPDNTREHLVPQFKPGVSQQTKDAVLADLAVFDFDAPPPNLQGFIGLLMADTTIPAAAHEQLMSYLAILQALIGNAPALQLQWGRIKTASSERALPLAGKCSDLTPIVQKIEAYAAQCHVQLTP